MTQPKLLIRRTSFFGLEPVSGRAPSPDTVEVAFTEVKQWFLDGRFAIHLFRHPEAELLTHRIGYISKPFLSGLLLRVLSYGPCFFSDDEGARSRIDVRALVKYFLQFQLDLVRIPFLLVDIGRELRRLERKVASRNRLVPLDLTQPPLYLRSDFVFGLSSGGSVGHTAGILNSLDRFTGKPILVTTDRTPMIRRDIETHVVWPTAEFCGFERIPALNFNRRFRVQAREALGGRPVAFVYQRCDPNNYAGLELAFQLKVPFVLEFNGSEIWVGRNWGKAVRHEAIARRTEKLLLKSADLVVAVSEPLRDELLAQGIPSEHILVNPNGVDADRYSPTVDGTAVRRRYGLERKRVLGFIGTFGRWHGAEVLADAYGRLLVSHPEWKHSVRLLLIGDGLTMPEVKSHLRRHEVLEMAILTGLVPQEEGPGYLAACDLLISPHVPNPDGTPFFGSPTKIFEYMAMGRGIIASDLDQIGQVLRHGETAWLVRPGDPDALALAMHRLLANEPLAQRLGQAARRDVLSHYTWEEHTRRIVESLRQRVAPKG